MVRVNWIGDHTVEVEQFRSNRKARKAIKEKHPAKVEEAYIRYFGSNRKSHVYDVYLYFQSAKPESVG